jgi:epoxyqueuosine reductase QueG
MTREDWRSMTNEQFIELFRGTPVARVKFDRFKNNIEAVLKDRNQI